jgi:hypothetical protein
VVYVWESLVRVCRLWALCRLRLTSCVIFCLAAAGRRESVNNGMNGNGRESSMEQYYIVCKGRDAMGESGNFIYPWHL